MSSWPGQNVYSFTNLHEKRQTAQALREGKNKGKFGGNEPLI